MRLVRRLVKPAKKLYLKHQNLIDKPLVMFYGLSVASCVYFAVLKNELNNWKKK